MGQPILLYLIKYNESNQNKLSAANGVTITTKCYFVVLYQVNEYTLTVNVFY